ncbi:hypothetical protein [Yersinia phage vB_YenS-P840]|nr:hypothetical protein [Yersinia phage vB_YenS-P840]
MWRPGLRTRGCLQINTHVQCELIVAVSASRAQLCRAFF